MYLASFGYSEFDEFSFQKLAKPIYNLEIWNLDLGCRRTQQLSSKNCAALNVKDDTLVGTCQFFTIFKEW